ncbi:DUF3291 domain-containing protein [Xinfangfangia sp. CPCC 101601]|uniref:DUF3291 domain-containing protein n=1 Tax=Pseudogemmobacter lacusdianii TaxID=3069608 RepID=A0ABU0VY29_9RHOB|nr:DUF3291 domain-containing protein [Xinfangfangia sp. CPCC 101601]MDQ2066669.1 DUF3291 domain-containing protein [Xinfangfangia sp. CPCC 101601]
MTSTPTLSRDMQLAEYNFGTLAYGWEDPRTADFANGLDRVYAIAESAEGYVWRMTDEDAGRDGALESDLSDEDRAQLNHPNIAHSLSVWTSVEALEHFVWNTVHRQFYARKAEWYAAKGNGNLVLWWVPAGSHPTAAEGMSRWRHRESHGDSDHAFGWSHLKDAQLWRTKACGSVAAE